MGLLTIGLVVVGILVLGLIAFALVAVAMGAKDVRVIRNALLRIACTVYVLRWRPMFRGRNWFARSLIAVAIAGAGYGLIDVVVIAMKEAAKRSRDGQLPESLAFLDQFYHLPHAVDAVLLILAFVLVVHRISEFRHRERLNSLPGAIAKVFAACLPAIGDPTRAAALRPGIIKTVLEETRRTLEAAGKRTVIATALTVDSATGLLTLCGCDPPNKYPDRMTLPINGSAAGAVVTGKRPVLVPSTKHLMAVDASDLESIDLVYQPAAGKTQKAETLLCLPIMKANEVVAVINISVQPRRQYTRGDTEIARLAVSFLESTY
jgi:hypothetical protein